MKELCIEGLANRNDRESCASICKGTREALTAAHTGWAIEPRNSHDPERRHPQARWKATLVASKSKMLLGSAGSETLRGSGTHARVETLWKGTERAHGSPWQIEPGCALGIRIGASQR